MKFPLIDDKTMLWGPTNKKGFCSFCGSKNNKEGVFIALSGGALKGNRHHAKMSSSLVGFLNLDLHDHDKMKGGYLDIVEDSPCGQFEFYFCSTKCLRKFFSDIVDAFEKTIEE